METSGPLIGMDVTDELLIEISACSSLCILIFWQADTVDEISQELLVKQKCAEFHGAFVRHRVGYIFRIPEECV